jgi:hypothetical protein
MAKGSGSSVDLVALSPQQLSPRRSAFAPDPRRATRHEQHLALQARQRALKAALERQLAEERQRQLQQLHTATILTAYQTSATILNSAAAAEGSAHQAFMRKFADQQLSTFSAQIGRGLLDGGERILDADGPPLEVDDRAPSFWERLSGRW